MPKVPDVSPTTGRPTSPDFVHTLDFNFVDNAGRSLLFRGVNLSGSSKAPLDRPSFLFDEFWDTAENGGESFIGRPLNLEDGSADVHLARLRGWGFNMLRFPVTWEALEHEGPGKYDYEFMDYIVKVLRKCGEYGFKVFINPHQDTWSRFSGGSGAPFWTLPACGMNPRHFTATQAAIVHCEYPVAHARDPASLPAMIWSTNYGRLASLTLFALFFAGETFAPKCIIDGVNIQEYLQAHFTEAFGQLADRIRDAGGLLDDVVIGWDSMNEPYEGLIAYQDLEEVPAKQGSTLKKGTTPSPAQSFRLGMGQAQTVDNWYFGQLGPRRDGSRTIDPEGVCVWADPETEPDGVHPKWGWRRSPEWELGTCIWAQHGIWDLESGRVLQREYFRTVPDEGSSGARAPVNFIRDFWYPQFVRYARRVREAHPEAILFVQPPVFALPPSIDESILRGRCCYSTHYYDGLTLITRHWNWFNADALGVLRGKYSSAIQAVKIGESAIRKSFQEQLGVLKHDAQALGDGAYPTIIGEIGIPYDMDKKRAYGYTDGGRYAGDYSRQETALDASLAAADGKNVLNWTVWTYCPDSTHMWGDGWNMEDLSLWSGDDMRAREKRVQMESRDTSDVRLWAKERAGVSVATATTSSSAASSSISLSILPDERCTEANRLARAGLTAWETPYDFLTDGARAVRAFCRPWPTVVVGVPRDIQFDISKATFKLIVRVRAEDKPRPLCGAGKTSSISSDLSGDGAKATELSTEIYLPLVHFASDQSMGRFAEQTDDSSDDGQDKLEGGPGPSGSSQPSSSTRTPPDGSGNSSSTVNLLSGDLWPSTFLTSNALDIEVRVSEGRWDVDGQTLKWWYKVPEEGEQEKELSIEVRRAKGMIKPLGAAQESSIWEMITEFCSGGCSFM